MLNLRSSTRVALAFGLLASGCATRDESAAPPAASPAVAGQANPAALTGRTWLARSIDGAAAVVPAERSRPSLVFDAEKKRVSGMAGVNRFSGGYQLEGAALKLGPLIATKMAGPPELNALEARYLRALERVTGWRASGPDLELLAGEQVVVRFSAAP